MTKNIKKSITFVSTDSGEQLIHSEIMKEAERRGYSVQASDDIFAKNEIVFYCQHECFPKNRSKLSVILLHDLGQMHGELWPNPWIKENWNKFDIGFLPDKNWEKMWLYSSSCYLARPRIGCYYGGWPKADILNDQDFLKKAKETARDLGLDPLKKTILYAPSWENDNKQLEFVHAMQRLDVNMLVKQYPWDGDMYPHICRNIKKVNEDCKGIKNLYIMDSKANIFEAIAMSDILISEESSTLVEAMLMGKPSVAVMDWVVPDIDPPRLPEAPFDFVLKTTKKDLSSFVQNILTNYDNFTTKIDEYKNTNFTNVGHAAKDIMDIIDSYIDGTDKYLKERLPVSSTKIKWSIKERVGWSIVSKKAYLTAKYSKEDSNKFMHTLYKVYKKWRGR